MTGRIVHSDNWQVTPEPFSIRTVGLPSGMYSAKFISQGRQTELTFVVFE